MHSTPLQTLVNPPDGHVDFSEKSHYFIPWLINVERQLNAIGAVDVLKEGYLCLRKPSIPSNPTQVDDEVVPQVPRNGERETVIRRVCEDSTHHVYEYMKQQTLFGQVLEIVMKNLSTTQQVSGVMPIFVEIELDCRQKAISIIQRFRKLHGTMAPHNIEPIIEEMDNIPPATDGASAENLISALRYWNCCIRLIHPSVASPDEILLSKLKEKLTGNMFAYVALMINCRGTNFNDAATQVCNTVSLYQRRLHLQQQQRTIASPAASLQHCSSAEEIKTNEVESLDGVQLNDSDEELLSLIPVATLTSTHCKKVEGVSSSSLNSVMKKTSSCRPSSDVTEMKPTLSRLDNSSSVLSSTGDGGDKGIRTKASIKKTIQPQSRIEFRVVSDDDCDVDDGDCFAW